VVAVVSSFKVTLKQILNNIHARATRAACPARLTTSYDELQANFRRIKGEKASKKFSR
jgi:hypothetical protein